MPQNSLEMAQDIRFIDMKCSMLSMELCAMADSLGKVHRDQVNKIVFHLRAGKCEAKIL